MSNITRLNCPICKTNTHTMERQTSGLFKCNKCRSKLSEESIKERWAEIETGTINEN